MREPDIGTIDRALYEERVLLRMLGMRRTIFTVPLDLAAIVHSASTRTIAAAERRQLLRFIEDTRIASDPGAWLQALEAATIEVLRACGEATAVELARDVPRLRQQLVVGLGRKWQGRQSASTRVLFLLAAEGRIVRARPRGSWTSSQYRWATVESWLGAPFDELHVEEAQEELVRRWLTTYGPGTERDLRWWTGWPARDVRRAVARVGARETDVHGARAYVLAGDEGPTPPPEPWVALLPALDPAVMGWAERSWYVGPHAAALFDRSGNPGPTVWADGRVVGGWAQRRSGEVVLRLLEDIGRDAALAVDAAAGRLEALLGATRVTPRFRTPLERELAAE